MNILVLWPKRLWQTKMSCVRRHSIEAISQVADIKVSGVDWSDYDTKKTVEENRLRS